MTTLVCNGLKMSKYEAYWLMGFPLINSKAKKKKLIVSIFFFIKKQTNKYKENLIIFTVNRDHSYKVRKVL